jgi:heme/copper-type cytochrome/quinol oxidase subunit 2
MFLLYYTALYCTALMLAVRYVTILYICSFLLVSNGKDWNGTFHRIADFDSIRDAQEETSTSTSTMMSFCMCVCVCVCVGGSVWKGREKGERKKKGRKEGRKEEEGRKGEWAECREKRNGRVKRFFL